MIRKGVIDLLAQKLQRLKTISFKLILFFIFFQSVSIYSQPIPIVLPYNNPYFHKIASGLQKAFSSPTKIFYLKMQLEEEEQASFISQIRESSPEFIITIGDESSAFIRTHIKDIPVLFSMVHSARILNPEDANLCGYESGNFQTESLKVLKQLKPEAKKIYALYSSTKSKEILNLVLDEIYLGVVLIKKEVATKEEFNSVLQNLPKDADGLLMINDPLYDEKNFLSLSEYAQKNKIPLFASFPSLVDYGATLTLIPDYKHLGVLTAELANKVMKKSLDCNIGPFLKFQNFLLYINEDNASKSAIEIPSSLKKRIATDQYLMAGIELLNKNMHKSAKKFFEKILSEDSENELAKYYLNQIVFEQTKEEITGYFVKGDALYERGQYDSARKVYSEILKLNPNQKDALNKYELCLKKESENYASEAGKLDKSNKPFLAIKKLKQAIQLYPSNQEAAKLLSQIKSRETKALDKYIQEAISLYEEREYKDAILKIENILLIDSGNKTANEYLRLSKLKLVAYQKLEDCASESKKEQDCKLLKK